MNPTRDHARPDALTGAYARGGEPSMHELVQSIDPGDDDALADLIEQDGRARLERALPIPIDRYLDAAPGLESRRIALDAAIEFCVRSAVRAGQTEEQAGRALIASHPRLARAVRIALGLNDGVTSTTMLVDMVRSRAALPLPCDFGPPLADGRRRFDVRQRLGSGTQGDVYLAADRALAEPDKPAWVAINRLNVKSMVDAERAAFAEEARKARRIEHPNVVRVLDRGEDDRDGEFVIYEYVDGGDLGAACANRAGPVPPREAAALVASVCAGVQAAHVAGVVHCDLKPSNVLLTREGVPKVADFGVANRLSSREDAATSNRGPIGTLAFISPEQFLKREDARAIPADIYALGGLLYFLLTAQYPNGPTPEEVERRHRADPAPAPPSARLVCPAVDNDLDAICSRALARDPKNRYQSAEALGADLRCWLERRPVEWARPSAARRLALLVRRQPVASAIAVLAGVLAIAGTAATVYTTMAARERQFKQRIDALNAVNAERERGYEDFRRSFESFAAVYRAKSLGQMTAEWIPPLTMLESLMGPVLFDPRAWSKPNSEQIWDARIQTARSHIAAERAAGRGSSVETALWLDTLAFWSMRAEKHGDAAQALSDGDAAWGSRLEPDDPWAVVRAAMRAGVNALAAGQEVRASGPNRDAGVTQRLRDAETALRDAITRLEKSDRRGTIRSSLVVILSRLYAPDLLNQPDTLKNLMEAESRPASPSTPPVPTPPPAATPPNTPPSAARSADVP